MKFTASNIIDQAGIHLFAHRITREFGHICRLNFGPDVGIDAFIEIVNGGDATGAHVSVQIKSTRDVCSGDRMAHYIDERHKSYWEGHTSPVLFAVVQIEDQRVWIKNIRDASALIPTATQYRIEVGPDHLLTPGKSEELVALALPDPSDGIMRRLREMARFVEPLQVPFKYADPDLAEQESERATRYLADLARLREFVQLDPARYGRLVSELIEDAETKIRRILNSANECREDM